MAVPVLERPWIRARNYYQRNASSVCFRKVVPIAPAVPLISFTFDDFPRTAMETGGGILTRLGLAGTYYAALGLAGKDDAAGRVFSASDLPSLIAQGHELGCHTFSHSHSWHTDGAAYEADVLRNRAALQQMVPGATFESFSFPISAPRPFTKGRIARYFRSCRGGGQRSNVGRADLNQLSAYFLEKTRDDIAPVKAIIDSNHGQRGWLIFATHDVRPDPSPYGVTPAFFEEVVRYAAASGARILPVARALDLLCAPS